MHTMAPVVADLLASVNHIATASAVAIDELRIIVQRWDEDGWPELNIVQSQLRAVVEISDFNRLLEDPLPDLIQGV